MVEPRAWPKQICAFFDGSLKDDGGSSVGIAFVGVDPTGSCKLLLRSGRVISGPCRSSTWAEVHALRYLLTQITYYCRDWAM